MSIFLCNIAWVSWKINASNFFLANQEHLQHGSRRDDVIEGEALDLDRACRGAQAAQSPVCRGDPTILCDSIGIQRAVQLVR